LPAGYSQGGADLYLGKPVAPDERVLVLNSLARRVLEQTDDTVWLMCATEARHYLYLNNF